MNKICKGYISEIKLLFPLKSKKERKYIKNFAINVEDYCIEENITSKEQLYSTFGTPMDVVNEYFSTVDTAYIVKKIKVAKWIKALLALIMVVAVVLSTMYAVIKWEEHKIFIREEIYSVVTVIE